MIKLKHSTVDLFTNIQGSIKEYMLVVRSKDCAPGTIEKYQYHLNLWKVWMESEGMRTLDEVTTFSLRKWNANIHETTGWATATVRLAITIVRTFLNWCYQERRCEDLGRVLIVPKLKQKTERTLTSEEVAKLFQVCDDSIEGIRDAAIVAMLYDTGFRASELCDLQLDDLYLNQKMRHKGIVYQVNYGVVKIKGGDDEAGWFGEETKGLLQKWLDVRPSVAKLYENAVFVAIRGNTPGKALTRSGLRDIVRRLGTASDISGVTPHAFRRGFTIAMDNAGASDNLKAKFGRWKSTIMIRRYTRAQKVGWQFKEYSPVKNLQND